MDYLDRARKELAEIEQQEQALLARKAKLKAFSEMGASLFGDAAVAPPRPLPPRPLPPIREAIEQRMLAFASDKAAREGTAKFIIESVATDLMLRHGYVQTEQVLEAAEAAGARIGATNKPLAVSTILSRSPKFKSDRSKGWSLNDESPTA